MSVFLTNTFNLQLDNAPPQPTYVTGTTYHANGMLNTVTMPSGVALTQVLDTTGVSRVGRRYTTGATTNWDSGTYSYDGSGNVRAIGSDSFVYDGISRLTQATVSAQTGNYTYDVYGNRLTATGETPLKVNTETNRICTNGTAPGCSGATAPFLTYDARGNVLTQTSGDTYTFDDVGMMATLVGGTSKTWKYFYTADDERIWAINANGTSHNAFWTLRDTDGKVLREISEMGEAFSAAGAYATPHTYTFTKDHLYHLGSLAATFEPGNTTRYYFSDHLGTPRLITTGTTGERHDYHPFGRELTTAGSISGRLRFTEHERDVNGGSGNTWSSGDLDYMHARYYSPVMGRFLSVDPISGDPRAPQSWNRYSYVGNNPTNFTDPTGMLQQPGDGSSGGGSGDRPCREELNGIYCWGDGGTFTPGGTTRDFLNNLQRIGEFLPPSLHYLYTIERDMQRSTAHGAMAFADGFNILGDPFASQYEGTLGTEYSWGIGLATFVAKSFIATTYGGAAAGEITTVTHYGSKGLKSGDWVMLGGRNLKNYIFSGKMQFWGSNTRASYSSGQVFRVASSTLRTPKEESFSATLLSSGLASGECLFNEQHRALGRLRHPGVSCHRHHRV